jgi:hypothetical protein
MSKNNSKQLAKLAFRFVFTVGIVNLFADIAYEGGRSIAGPFLGSLGASNVLAVPALALAGNWQFAAILIIAELTGRAIRKPSVDAMISYAGKSIGRAMCCFGCFRQLDC